MPDLAGLLTGLSSYKDECFDAAEALDRRRQAHERRFKRYRLQHRPATKKEMIAFVESFGATELVHSDEFRHVPVAPVAGGVAFAPRRMTLDVLTEVYESLHRVRRPEGRVYNRVEAILAAYPTGLRKRDVVDLIEVSEKAVRNALEALEFDGKVTVKEEPTRGNGSRRKRYYPAQTELSALSIDPALTAGVL